MRVNCMRFDGSSHSLDTQEPLSLIAGNVSWFTEYRHVNVVSIDALYCLLMEFFRHRNYCHLSGSYVRYTTATLHSFRAVTLYIAMTDTPVLNLLFQQGSENIESFTVGVFRFWLVDAHPQVDIYSYLVSKDGFYILMIIFGIDRPSNCDPRSNVDFVHFV